MADLPVSETEFDKYFFVVKQDKVDDPLLCFCDNEINEGEIFALKAVEVGENERGLKEVRMKLIKIKPVFKSNAPKIILPNSHIVR